MARRNARLDDDDVDETRIAVVVVRFMDCKVVESIILLFVFKENGLDVMN